MYNDSLKDAVESALKNGQKIKLIKMIRTTTGKGLKDSKKLAEEHFIKYSHAMWIDSAKRLILEYLEPEAVDYLCNILEDSKRG